MEYNRRDDVARLSNEMREKEKCHYQEIDSLASQLGTSQTTLSSTITQVYIYNTYTYFISMYLGVDERDGECVVREGTGVGWSQSLSE